MKKTLAFLTSLGFVLTVASPTMAQRQTDYSRIANYCPSQAYKLHGPRLQYNLDSIPYPRGSQQRRDREQQYHAAFNDRMREAIQQCENSLARNRFVPWGPR